MTRLKKPRSRRKFLGALAGTALLLVVAHSLWSRHLAANLNFRLPQGWTVEEFRLSTASPYELNSHSELLLWSPEKPGDVHATLCAVLKVPVRGDMVPDHSDWASTELLMNPGAKLPAQFGNFFCPQVNPTPLKYPVCGSSSNCGLSWKISSAPYGSFIVIEQVNSESSFCG